MGNPPCPPSIPQPQMSPVPPGAGTPGFCWEAAGEVTHLPALLARLPEGAGAASMSLWVKRKMVSIPGQSSRAKAVC